MLVQVGLANKDRDVLHDDGERRDAADPVGCGQRLDDSGQEVMVQPRLVPRLTLGGVTCQFSSGGCLPAAQYFFDPCSLGSDELSIMSLGPGTHVSDYRS